MSRDEGQTAESENRDNYEAAVLDFLDREMAAVEPAKKNEQSDELDALVSNLLKQVITESDQPGEAQTAVSVSDDMADVLSEFPPKEEEVAAPAAKPPESPVKTPEAVQAAFEKPKILSSRIPTASLFALIQTSNRKTPLIAIAAACLLAIIGGTIYHFSNSSKSVPVATVAQPTATAPVSFVSQDPATPPPTVEPAAKTAPAKSPETVRAARPVPVVPAQKPSPAAEQQAAKPSKQAPAPILPAVAVKPTGPVPNNGRAVEMPQATQPAPTPVAQAPVVASTPVPPPPPPAATPVVATEKPAPAPPPVSNNVAPPSSAVAEKAPAPPAPAAPVPAENTASNPQPSAPAPVVPRNLVPAVPISQVSPIYPELAIRRGASDSIILDLQIDEQGKVVKATPVSGPALFYIAAVDAAMKWRYKPASIGGTNVRSQSRVTMNFNLKK